LALAVGDLDRGGGVDGAHALVERPLEHHPQHDDALSDRRRRRALGTNTGSGRYSLGADTKYADKVLIWYQVDLVTA
jgi:hypothetical protein